VNFLQKITQILLIDFKIDKLSALLNHLACVLR